MNKKQTHNHTTENHSQDTCEGCQEERRENNMLVDFYERLGKIESKVERVRGGVTTQQSQDVVNRRKIEVMSRLMLNKPQQILKGIKEHDSKEMGYELASALIERQIKTKMENQRLQAIIDQLQKDKQKLQQEHRISKSTEKSQPKLPSTRYGDVLDEVRKTNDSSYFIQQKKVKEMGHSFFEEGNRKYWEESSTGQEQTSFSNFTAVKEKSKSEHKTFQGMNLWLYQFKPEEINPTPVKALKNAANVRRTQEKQAKYKSKF